MSPSVRPARLLGDIGGTNARFAWQDSDDAAPRDVQTLPTSEHATLGDAMAHYLRGLNRGTPPWCAFGIANPIVGDQVKMTNHHWSFSISALQAELGFERLVVVNDFTALALALPGLPASDLRQVGGRAAVPNAPIALIGPGTGLGVSGLLPSGEPGRYVALQGEGGHVTLAAINAREMAVLSALRERFGHASAERAVSGSGLVWMHEAQCAVDGVPVPEGTTAASISAKALDGSDARCVETLDLFCGFLGSVAGDLALTLGARGGVYIGGGIVPRLGERFAASAFRARMEAKGRLRGFLESIPAFVIHTSVSPALLGASRAL
jgi:glucokinase